MTARRLTPHVVEKPWGRERLWPGFEQFERVEPVGEIWFQDESAGADAELLVKYLFTSEKLSVQVHPDDAQAQARGFARGKDEAWLILSAEPDSTIALGPKRPLDPGMFRGAIEDGSIADLLDWRPVRAGDFIYSPAGTVHAIGAGLTLIEIQQNLDLTYRLFDYGRPRELHVGDGVAVSNLRPFESVDRPAERRFLALGPKFVVELLGEGEHIHVDHGPALLVPVTGRGQVDGQTFIPGECWQVPDQIGISVAAGEALLAYPGEHRG